MARKTCVVDTNVLLHYVPLEQIQWPDLLSADEVEIVLVAKVRPLRA